MRRARAAWLLFAVHTAACVGLVVLLSDGSAFASLAMVPGSPRNRAGAVLCLAGAAAAVDLDDLVGRRRSRQVAARAGPAETRGGSGRLRRAGGVGLVSTRVLAPNLHHRKLATTSRACARPCGRTAQRAVRLTRPGGGHRPPVRKSRPGVGGHRAGSRSPVFDVPTSRLRVVTPEGRLADPGFVDPAAASPGDNPQCSHPVRADGATIPLRRRSRGQWVARIGYYTSTRVVRRPAPTGDEVASR